MRIYVNFYLLPCSADSLSVMLTEDLQSSGRKAWLPRAAGQHKPFKSWLLFNLVRHKMPCASAFAFTFSNYLFFQHKELKYHCVLFQTCFLSCSKSIKLGNRQGSCLGASTISNTVMLTHFYEGCVCSQWKTTLKTVRQMTKYSDKVCPCWRSSCTVIIFLPFLNTKQQWPLFQRLKCSLIWRSRAQPLRCVSFEMNWLLILPAWLGFKPWHLRSLTKKDEKKATVSLANC